ncbi:MAG: polysaccharide biosynthesis/export family protein [Deltaproteobacteria bacterium]|nr:polysaccharide biosynthesis/export family protein [Deltaproteobacteria bacterium]
MRTIKNIERKIGVVSNLQLVALAVCLASIILDGCVATKDRAIGQMDHPAKAIASAITNHFPTSLYRLSEGDSMEIMYLTRPQETSTPYKLQVKDAIDVEFTYHPELNRTVRIRPDGKISIPRKKDVNVAGMIPDQVSTMLKQVYSDLLKDPEITVTVREFGGKLDELQKALATAPYGQARLVTIRPDGRISVPMIADVQAAGVTVPQLTEDLNKAYKNLIADMNISVLLRDVVGNLVFVDGQVAKPGVFTMKGPTTVQQAIAMANGTTATGETRSVLVINKGPNGQIMPKTVDLTRITGGTDYLLNKNDLVYVPRSLISRADIWVDQNIKQLLLFNGWSLGLGTSVGRSSAR